MNKPKINIAPIHIEKPHNFYQPKIKIIDDGSCPVGILFIAKEVFTIFMYGAIVFILITVVS